MKNKYLIDGLEVYTHSHKKIDPVKILLEITLSILIAIILWHVIKALIVGITLFLWQM